MNSPQTSTFRSPLDEPPALDYVPGQLLVRVQPGAVWSAFSGAHLTKHDALRLAPAVTEPIDSLRRNRGLRSIVPLFIAGAVAMPSLARLALPQQDRLNLLTSVVDAPDDELAGLSVLNLPEDAEIPKIATYLEESNAFDLAEPVPARWLNGLPDPTRNLQWGLRAVRLFSDSHREDLQPIIGVIDSGIALDHPVFEDIEIAYDHDRFDDTDLLGHGTHVASLIAGRLDDEVGCAGVCPGAPLHVWKVMPDRPRRAVRRVDWTAYVRALRAASRAPLQALNLSISGTRYSKIEEDLFRRLADSGVVAVAAMGNRHNHGNQTEYPAGYPDVVSVGSICETGDRSDFSNTGEHIDIVAPGSNVLSAVPLQPSPYRTEVGYAVWAGTSFSTPLVTAAAGIIAVTHPDWTPEDIRSRLCDTARKVEGMAGAPWTPEYGAGVLNLSSAL